MIYTIGLQEVYEQALGRNPEVYKREGGSVWHSREDAQHYLDEADQDGLYRVYAVDAEWGTDTVQDHDGWASLTRDARLFRNEELP